VIYKPDRVVRSMKELLVLLEDELHARGIGLHILTGICAGLHRPDGATIADKMLFMVAAMAPRQPRHSKPSSTPPAPGSPNSKRKTPGSASASAPSPHSPSS
jgi:hypothetical protein